MKKYSKKLIIKAIQRFYIENNKLPTKKDFSKTKGIYPNYTTVRTYFGSWNKAIEAAGFEPSYVSNKKYIDCSKKGIIESIQRFYKENNKIPQTRDFQNNNNYPTNTTVIKHFGTWNNAIKTAGYEPSIYTGFGIRTYGKDGMLYRSKAEAYFADNYLFGIYQYLVEPYYPDNAWRYDWYIIELDLYIELDGEIRPERIKEKIEVNKQLDRNCLIIKTKDIYNKDKLEDFA